MKQQLQVRGGVNYTYAQFPTRTHTHTHLKPDVSDTAGPYLCDMLDSGAGLGGLNEVAHQMPTRQAGPSRAEPD